MATFAAAIFVLAHPDLLPVLSTNADVTVLICGGSLHDVHRAASKKRAEAEKDHPTNPDDGKSSQEG
jgi:hypothetical protein